MESNLQSDCLRPTDTIDLVGIGYNCTHAPADYIRPIHATRIQCDWLSVGCKSLEQMKHNSNQARAGNVEERLPRAVPE